MKAAAQQALVDIFGPGDERENIIEMAAKIASHADIIQRSLQRVITLEELDEGPPLPLKDRMLWKRPLIIKAWQEGLSARACARVFDVSHEMAALCVKGIERPLASACARDPK